jgi:hypothetical protein
MKRESRDPPKSAAISMLYSGARRKRNEYPVSPSIVLRTAEYRALSNRIR